MLLTGVPAAVKSPLDSLDPTLLATLALFVPLAALLTVLVFTVDSRRVSAWVSIAGTALGALCSLGVVAAEWHRPVTHHTTSTFLQFFTGQAGAAGQFQLQWGVLVDPLSATVLVTVLITSLVLQVAALDVIRRDEGVVRFFSAMTFSTFALAGVILSTTYFELFFFFGLLSLATYLLVGHRWSEPNALSGARKVFWLTALGDAALLVGIIYLFMRFQDLDFGRLTPLYASGKAGPTGLLVIALLVFCGAIAKSAQLPLQAWLPETTGSPFPAVAQIQGAGLSIAGLYLVARTYGLFHSSPRALAVVAVVGGLTALAGGLTALAQDNLKRLLSYTTMGTLGLMMFALGIGAYGAAVYLLVTAAFSVALLFLAAGVVSSAMRTESLREMGGLWSRMPGTARLLLLGAGAAAGVPLLGTFFSQAALVSETLRAHHQLLAIVPLAALVLSVAALGRMAGLVLHGVTARRRRFDPDKLRDPSGRLMTAMVLLAILALVTGVFGLPGLRSNLPVFLTFPHVPVAGTSWTAVGVVAAVGLVAAVLTWFGLLRTGALRSGAERIPGLRQGLFAGPAAEATARRGVLPLAGALGWVERQLIERAVLGVADSVALLRTTGGRIPVPGLRVALGAIAGGTVVLLLIVALAGGHGAAPAARP